MVVTKASLVVCVVVAALVANSLATISNSDEERMKTVMNLIVENSCLNSYLKPGHGECVFDNVNVCDEGYEGSDCDLVATFNETTSTDIETVTQDQESPTRLYSAYRWMTSSFIENITVGWPTRSGITQKEAEDKCNDVIMTDVNPFKSACEEVMTKESLLRIFDGCVRNIKIISQLNAAYEVLATYGGICLFPSVSLEWLTSPF